MSTVATDLLQNRLGTNAPDVLKGQFTRAWVNGNGTSVPASIVSSFGVSSLGDAGVGLYVVNYTAAFSLITFPCTGSNSLWHTIAAPASATTSVIRPYDTTHALADSGWIGGITAGTLA